MVVPFWYCCILTTERLAVDALCINLITTAGQPLPLAVWEAVWAVASWGVAERNAAARAAWAIYDTEILIPDEPPIPAVQVSDLVTWTALALLVVAPGEKCPDGCTQPVWL